MNGLDQVIVAFWFLPVVLYILVPLCLTFFWGIASVFVSFKTTGVQEEGAAADNDAVTA